MTLLLRTFGPIELVTDTGQRVSGAGGQPKPLLILALAALTPGGVSRDRLIRALWPGVGRERARASLKQHLYGLRQATGNPGILTGAVRIAVTPGSLRVDAHEFDEHVDAGRLVDAGKLLRGELLENAPLSSDTADEVNRLVKEVRDRWAVRVALVRSRVATDDPPPSRSDTPTPDRSRATVVERELRAAARRFVQGVITIPSSPVAAGHRVAWCSSDLLEAIATAESSGIQHAKIEECISEATNFWSHVDGVRRLQTRTSEGEFDSVTREWLATGSVRSATEIGRALERHLLQSPIATSVRDRMHWQHLQALRLMSSGAEQPRRILLLGAATTQVLQSLVPLFVEKKTVLVVADQSADALALVNDRFDLLGKRLICLHGDAVLTLEEIAACGPFDLILIGQTLDGLTTRSAEWLIAKLANKLTEGGRLCLATLTSESQCGPWLRHVAAWPVVERDNEEMMALVPTGPFECTECVRSHTAEAWWMTIERRESSTPVGGKR